MKIDLHVHSAFSKRPSTWILQKVGCAESYTHPVDLYHFAKQRGMGAVTITDHNCIDGCREISHLPDTFTGCEVTTYFPEDGCKIHVLVYRISEVQFTEIERLRENVYDLIDYLVQEKIIYVLSHPLYKVNDTFSVDHFEKCLLLFRNFEINGDTEYRCNEILRHILEALTQQDIERLAHRHHLQPSHDTPWQKRYLAGSDDHSSLSIAFSHTEVPGARNVDEFWEGVAQNRANLRCPHPATPMTLAHNLYGVAYQFYNDKLGIGRHHERSVLVRFLDRMLQTRSRKEPALWNRMVYHWRRRQHRKAKTGEDVSISQLLQHEAQKLIEGDVQLKAMLRLGHGASSEPDQHWFRFVTKVSNKMLQHFGGHMVHQLSGGNPFDLFHTIGSAGALYTLLAPYFVAYTMYSNNRRFTEQVADRFDVSHSRSNGRLSVGHFTDTFWEINGVARMLQEELMMAKKMNKDLTVITSPSQSKRKQTPGLHYFEPVAVHSLPEYPEVKTCVPPLLEMMAFCYQRNFTHLHAATPGPMGLSAMAIAKVLKLPLFTTYHTSIPQYAGYLTEDTKVEDLAWRYILWFYNQADVIFCPSRSTSDELTGKGIAAEKMRIIPRGVDTRMFHPNNTCDTLTLPQGLKLLYVGRVSKEKDLPLLGRAFKKLASKHHDVHLVVVGDGPYLEEMKHTMKGTPCVFTGYLTGRELTAVFPMCDLFVFPSTTDTFGNVVLEAQASGLPIIVTDQGGPCENLIPGQTGLVVPGGDERAFGNAMEQLVTHRQRLEEMARRAYDYAAGRDFHKAFEEYWQLYENPQTCTQTQNMVENFASGFVRSPFAAK